MSPLFQCFLVFHIIFINPFLAIPIVSILYPLKTPENQGFSTKGFLVFSGGIRLEHQPEMG